MATFLGRLGLQRMPLSRFNGTQASPSGSGTTTGTFSSVPIGREDSSRLVVVFLRSFNSPVTNLVSATIGGVAATVHLNVTSGICNLAMISAVVPTGSTANIVVTYSANIGTASGYRVWSYSLYYLNSTTPTGTAQDTTQTGQTMSISINIAAPHGVMVACAVPNAGGSGASALGGTIDNDSASAGAVMRNTGLPAETPHQMDLTFATPSATNFIMIGGSWS